MSNEAAWLQKVEAVDWNQYEWSDRSATEFEGALRSLMTAAGPEEVRDAYWGVELGAYPGGTVHAVCEPLVAVFVEALRHSEISQAATVAVLDAIYMILNSDGHDDIRLKCAASTREIRGTLEALSGQPTIGAAAKDVLELI